VDKGAGMDAEIWSLRKKHKMRLFIETRPDCQFQDKTDRAPPRQD